MFVEFEELLANAPLRQGDVFRWLEPSDVWHRYGVVVTADCDLTHGKHDGVVSYVPALRASDYLALFYLPKQLELHIDALGAQVTKAARGLQAEYMPEYEVELSRSAIEEWLTRDGPEAIPAAMEVSPGDQRESFIELAQRWKNASEAFAVQDFGSQAAALLDLRGLGAPDAKMRDKLADTLSSRLCSLPGDGMFLSSIGPGLTEGYVAYARRPRELREDLLALRQSELGAGVVETQRISRLRTPYRYRLTQQMTQVFSDIGLPSEYEAERARSSANLVAALRANDE